MPRHSRLSALVVTLFAAAAHGQWTPTVLHPSGATSSNPAAVDASVLAGTVDDRAAVWPGPTGPWTTLASPGSDLSEVRALWNDAPIGFARISGSLHAAIWTPATLSFRDVHPAGANESKLFAGSGSRCTGYFVPADMQSHAAIYDDGQWTDLNPAGAVSSQALAISGNQQVGYATMAGIVRAGLWTGTPASWVSLHPPGAASSTAYATNGDLQAGTMFIGQFRACLWRGTPASVVDLTPAGATASGVNALAPDYQVGWAQFNDAGAFRTVAGVWRGTSESWQELPNPAGFEWDEVTARAVWREGPHIRVTGVGNIDLAQRALVWTHPLLCGAADFDNDGDTGTDQDIESFIACLGGTCCAACGTADFNADGDTGTDADIESFFRVLGGGAC